MKNKLQPSPDFDCLINLLNVVIPHVTVSLDPRVLLCQPGEWEGGKTACVQGSPLGQLFVRHLMALIANSLNAPHLATLPKGLAFPGRWAGD